MQLLAPNLCLWFCTKLHPQVIIWIHQLVIDIKGFDGDDVFPDWKAHAGAEVERGGDRPPNDAVCSNDPHHFLLEDTGYLDCKPTSVPMDPKLTLSSIDGDLIPDVTHYRRLVGRLLYLTLSRPDITFAVHRLTQFLSQPRLPHLKAVHHLHRYLKNQPGQGLFFSSSSPLQVRAYSDVAFVVPVKFRHLKNFLCRYRYIAEPLDIAKKIPMHPKIASVF
ncbi:hypothetical protein EZV62_004515 [Acer yangbiense]|uniref:Reverse transcriptase Ty1/copia-type domain-containing protein n=1 Tax=Acer yangbiense TaxID=1000413 RepID=A0A5C7IKA7_9ROSI|nr:hypothetical protein EZV62_004515 [Acer yangbiense]